MGDKRVVWAALLVTVLRTRRKNGSSCDPSRVLAIVLDTAVENKRFFLTACQVNARAFEEQNLRTDYWDKSGWRRHSVVSSDPNTGTIVRPYPGGADVPPDEQQLYYAIDEEATAQVWLRR